MSLPGTVHARIRRSFAHAPEDLTYVALLEEMPGVSAVESSPEGALESLQAAVNDIQARTGGGKVEVVPPPHFGLTWVQYGEEGAVVVAAEDSLADTSYEDPIQGELALSYQP